MPKFSILTPVYNPPSYAFLSCIDSVLAQTEADWEWCVVDDASTNQETIDILADLPRRDPRIRVQQRTENGGIAAASQDALELATGDFIALLDHDDMLSINALECIDRAIGENPSIDYLYSDEDKVNEAGQYFDEFLKPDWSPERLRGQNYCCHLSVLRRSLVHRVGGFREGFDGSQDYDLILRVTEKARAIHHVPEILYHWRVLPGSTALSINEKPDAFLSAQRSLQEHLSRVGINGTVEAAGFGYHRINRTIDGTDLVSIVIPTCGKRKVIGGVDISLVLNAILSIDRISTYRNFEIVVVADDHTPPSVIRHLKDLSIERLQVVQYNRPFNFSDKCNSGVEVSTGNLVLLLNDDVQIISPNWLEWLIGLVAEPDVGMVGPMLIYENGLIQSAGHSNTPSPRNFGTGYFPNQPGDFGIFAISREVSGVTGAAAILRRDVYCEVGGLSVQFPNCFNDVDLAFKLLDAGYRILWTPHAQLYHFESASRDATVDKHELDLLLSRWGRFFNDDRYCRQS